MATVVTDKVKEHYRREKTESSQSRSADTDVGEADESATYERISIVIYGLKRECGHSRRAQISVRDQSGCRSTLDRNRDLEATFSNAQLR